MPTQKEHAVAVFSAESLIELYGISHPSEIDVEIMASDRGAYVCEKEMRGSIGRLVRKGRYGIITVDSQIKEAGRRRFTVAHELGHFELHKENDPVFSCTEDMIFGWAKSSRHQEVEANAFAAELLMPCLLFRPYCDKQDPSFSVIQEIAGEFEATLTATARRYVNLCSYRCALVVSEDGKVRWYEKNEDFEFRIVPAKTPLDKNTYASDFFTKKPLPESPELVPASAWLEDSRIESSNTIMEHSIALPRYNTVLTLLWIEADSDLDDLDTEEDPGSDHFNPDGKRYQW